MTRRSAVLGSGSALPAREVTNAELAEQVDTSDEWIAARTGIRSRFIAGDGETTATLAAAAQLMSARRIGSLVIRGAGGRLAGILSERDIVSALGCGCAFAVPIAGAAGGAIDGLVVAADCGNAGFVVAALGSG